MTKVRLVAWICGWAVLFAGVSSADEPALGKRGLHLPRSRKVPFTVQLRDSAGNQWDIQSGMNVGRGTNYLLSGGLRCYIQNSQVQSSTGAWGNATGDEIEIGPQTVGRIQVYRRCKVYKDKPLARWLDILVNTSPTKQTVSVRIHSYVNTRISQQITSSGQQNFEKKDWAFISVHDNMRPSLLQIVCGPKSKLRPTVQFSGNQIIVNYQVTIPPRGTAVLCHFASQGQDVAALKRLMEKKLVTKLLRELPASVRRLIVNFRTGDLLEEIELLRSGAADTVVLSNGDFIQGLIANQSFTLHSQHGELTIPAGQVLGLVAAAGQDSPVRAVLADGQIVSGRLAGPTLKLILPTGGELNIPCARIKQCGYRITKNKPDKCPFTSPLIMLRNGDRLAFDAAKLGCALQTRHGPVRLEGEDLFEVRLRHAAHGVHRATFLNGSALAGVLTPERITLPLQLGPELDVHRDMVLAIRFAAEAADRQGLTHVLLNNEDELLGRLADESYTLATDFGIVEVKPANILSMSFDRLAPPSVAITLWNGQTVLRGRLEQDSLRFIIQPGPEVKLHTGQIVKLLRCEPLPPQDKVTRAQKLLARLSASSFKDRQEAEEALVEMGKDIVPLLKEYLTDTDPEVRSRVRAILGKLGVDIEDNDAGQANGGKIQGFFGATK